VKIKGVAILKIEKVFIIDDYSVAAFVPDSFGPDSS